MVMDGGEVWCKMRWPRETREKRWVAWRAWRWGWGWSVGDGRVTTVWHGRWCGAGRGGLSIGCSAVQDFTIVSIQPYLLF